MVSTRGCIYLQHRAFPYSTELFLTAQNFSIYFFITAQSFSLQHEEMCLLESTWPCFFVFGSVCMVLVSMCIVLVCLCAGKGHTCAPGPGLPCFARGRVSFQSTWFLPSIPAFDQWKRAKSHWTNCSRNLCGVWKLCRLAGGPRLTAMEIRTITQRIFFLPQACLMQKSSDQSCLLITGLSYSSRFGALQLTCLTAHGGFHLFRHSAVKCALMVSPRNPFM